jgi:hypothetical protein
MSLAERIVGVVMSPRATFERIVAFPRPVGVLFVAALLMGIATTLPMALSEDIFQSSVQTQIEMVERLTGQPATPEVAETIARRARTGIYFAPLNFFIGLPIMSLLFAAIYWVVFNAVLGGTASFKQVLAIVTHSHVISALAVLLAAPIQFMQGRMTPAGPFTLRGIVPFLPDNSVWATVLGFTNVFTIWGLVVTAIGLAVLYRRNTRNIAIALIVTYFLIAAGLVSFFGRLFGMGR